MLSVCERFFPTGRHIGPAVKETEMHGYLRVPSERCQCSGLENAVPIWLVGRYPLLAALFLRLLFVFFFLITPVLILGFPGDSVI